jgi:hypothetical protein
VLQFPVHDFLRLPSTLSRLNDMIPDTAEAQNLVNEISKLHRGLISVRIRGFSFQHVQFSGQIGAIVEFALKTMPDDGETCAACQRLRQKISAARHKRQNLGFHQQKRNLVPVFAL